MRKRKNGYEKNNTNCYNTVDPDLHVRARRGAKNKHIEYVELVTEEIAMLYGLPETTLCF